MEEFTRLFLTGKRAENMARFDRAVSIFGMVGALLMLVPVILSFVIETQPLPLIIAFSVLGSLFGVANFVLKQYKTAYIRGLAELQNAANETELRGEEREHHAKLYKAWTETLGKRGMLDILAAISSLLGYAVLISATIVCAVLSVPQFVMLAACTGFCILEVIPTVLEVTMEGKARTALYERAQEEIEEIKRNKLGLTENRIASESENARAYSSVPLSVMSFLKEDAERAAFQHIAKRSGIAGFFIGLAIAAALILSSIDVIWEQIGPTATWLLAGAYFVVVFAVFFVFLFPLERQKKEIYRRNHDKLGAGEVDSLRRQLQAAWLRLQKSGNIMFSVALTASIVVGIVVGLAGYFTVAETALAECIGSCILCFLIPAAIISVAVWFVMFTVYRKRVRPIELLLKEKCREEGK